MRKMLRVSGHEGESMDLCGCSEECIHCTGTRTQLLTAHHNRAPCLGNAPIDVQDTALEAEW